MTEVDYYALLGVEANADTSQIRQAYRQQISKHHPDRPGGSAEQARWIEEARSVLLDPKARARYDASRLGGVVIDEAVQALAEVGSRAVDQLTLTLNARGRELVGALGKRLLDVLNQRE